MVKKFIAIFIIMTLALSGIAIVPVAAASEEDVYDAVAVNKIQSQTSILDLKAKAAILVDGKSGSILLEKASHEKLPIASVTKIMTMLLIMEAVDSGKIKMEDMVSTSENAYSMGGSQVYLAQGEEHTVQDMLKAVAIHSANDASVALAEKVAGSEEVFVAEMNEKAKALGMNDTHFLDTTGLTDEGHYSSAYDVALMSRELIIKHPEILKFTSTWHDTFRNGEFSLDNTNKLVHHYQGANGLKTGFTTPAGHCLAASALRNNMQLIAVVLGEPDSNTRFAESRKLLDYGFANYEINKVNTKGEVAGEITVKKGTLTNINAIFKEDVELLISRADKGKVANETVMLEELTAPIEEGQKVGEMVYKVGNKVVGKAELVADRKVDKASFFVLFWRMILSWFGLGKA